MISRDLIGFTCAYTPLPLIDAAGFTPYRILPLGHMPEQSGALLHDNLCPHVKRILDRALAGEAPELAGLVIINSCDTMRRLAEAWLITRPQDRVYVVDLPPTRDESMVAYFAEELRQMSDILADWGGRAVDEDEIERSVERYRTLSAALAKLDGLAGRGLLPGGREELQTIYNLAVTAPIEETLARIDELPAVATGAESDGVPVYLTGNVLVEPPAFRLFEQSGAMVVGEDLCTGARMHAPPITDGEGDIYQRLARGLLARRPCARTFDAERPGGIAQDIAAQARAAGARGVIAHVLNFCDPYLARVPTLRAALQEAGLPLLVLNGDGTLSSLGQFHTRIEAFVEMLKEAQS
ncbi:MAG: 2-hydroxyacyl-CoA dehydratase subunit D [Alphaproteobacteria bacterium]